jgi:hypothetical protein
MHGNDLHNATNKEYITQFVEGIPNILSMLNEKILTHSNLECVNITKYDVVAGYIGIATELNNILNIIYNIKDNVENMLNYIHRCTPCPKPHNVNIFADTLVHILVDNLKEMDAQILSMHMYCKNRYDRECLAYVFFKDKDMIHNTRLYMARLVSFLISVHGAYLAYNENLAHVDSYFS